MATANQAISEAVYRRVGLATTPTQAMTIQGSVLKMALLVLILLVTGAYAWTQTVAGAVTLAYGLLIAGLIGGFITALVTVFMHRVSPFTAPICAALEGLVLGRAMVPIPAPGGRSSIYPSAPSASGRRMSSKDLDNFSPCARDGSSR
jgi:uncharacterized YccA/Bax inhibitor family protein